MTRRRPRAFTLLEVLLATALVAVLAAALYTSMSIGFRARDSAREQLRAVREALVAMELAEQDLQSVLPPRGILAGAFIGTRGGDAAGAADSLDFYALGRDARANSDASDRGAAALDEGLRHVQLLLRTDVSPASLVRRVQRNLLAATAEEAGEETLARGVRAFSLRYYDGLDWYDHWDSTARDNTLPLAVELTIELEASAPTDALRPYRLTQIVALSCGQPTAASAEDLTGETLE